MGTQVPPRPLKWAYLGRVAYADASHLQDRLRSQVQAGTEPDHLLLLEHEPIYTLGRSASRSDLRFGESERSEKGIETAETDRGGQVTYHGPGQLVGYPILNLNPDRRDVRRYVRDLQSVLIRTLARYSVEARGGASTPEIGVWVGAAKIASIGIHLSRWVSTHGFALNVATDLAHFEGIVPCGLPGVRMTSLAMEKGTAPDLETIAGVCAHEFAEVFGRVLEPSAGSLAPAVA